MMRLIPLALAPLLFAACVTTVSHSDAVPAPKSSNENVHALAIAVDYAGHLHTDGWNLEIADIPELVKQRHPARVVIRGWANSSFSKAVEVRNAFKEAGISDVTIATVDPGAGG